jgi:flagellar basal-body rod protein FlgF
MSGSIYLAASGAILQQLKLEILANNVANVNTSGYKEDLPIFRLYDDTPTDQNLNSNNRTNTLRQEISPYTPPFAVRTNFSAGSIRPTGNPLDLALNGDGFFTVQTAEGVRYTRQGNFRLNENGVLVTQNDDSVLGQGSEIVIDGREITVGSDGTIQVDGSIVDQLRLVRFDDLTQLKKVAHTMFEPADGFGPEIELDADDTNVNQGFLELSNVNAIRAMTDMIEALRVSEAYQKVIHSADDATSKIVNGVGDS